MRLCRSSCIARMFQMAVIAIWLTCQAPSSFAQTHWQTEWTQRQEAAKKEGKVVISIPPSPELRKVLEDAVKIASGVSAGPGGAGLKRKFGFEVEVVPGASAKIIRRIADEYQAESAIST